MLRKPFILKAPVDTQVVPLEQFLTLVAKSTTETYSGTYSGRAKVMTIDTPFTPKVIIISPVIDVARMVSPQAGELVFTLDSNPRTSWVPSEGFVNNAVTGIQYKGFTIGTHAGVNTLSQNYVYFILG